jgi:EAL domain-containing protein (putative c-di-GMP-specific phosphodiesterase class I)
MCRVIPGIARLRDIGVRIALGDFGAGYSPPSYLRRFQAQHLFGRKHARQLTRLNCE